MTFLFLMYMDPGALYPGDVLGSTLQMTFIYLPNIVDKMSHFRQRNMQFFMLVASVQV